MEVTGKNQDECIVALHDCNGDVNRAINILLEGSSDTVRFYFSIKLLLFLVVVTYAEKMIGKVIFKKLLISMSPLKLLWRKWASGKLLCLVHKSWNLKMLWVFCWSPIELSSCYRWATIFCAAELSGALSCVLLTCLQLLCSTCTIMRPEVILCSTKGNLCKPKKEGVYLKSHKFCRYPLQVLRVEEVSTSERCIKN